MVGTVTTRTNGMPGYHRHAWHGHERIEPLITRSRTPMIEAPWAAASAEIIRLPLRTRLGVTACRDPVGQPPRAQGAGTVETDHVW
jgi:hypothetical protein